jgi:hypothetical protein
MDRPSDRGKIRDKLQGHALVIALSRTRADIAVKDRYGRMRLLTAADAIRIVCESESWRGTGSKRRVRSIYYEAPPEKPEDILDSGSWRLRYPMPNQANGPKFPTFAKDGCGLI